jgi:hypothetical protein
MTTSAPRPIAIKSGDISGEGLMHMRGVDTRERRIHAAKIWGLMWLFALLSVPICGLHLVLVPLFFVAGPVMAFRRYRVTEVPDHISGTCPSGKEEFTLALKKGDSLPMSVNCPVCNAWLNLLKKEEASVP